MSVLRWDVCYSGFVLFPWKPNENPCHIKQHHQMAATNDIAINALIGISDSVIAEKIQNHK